MTLRDLIAGAGSRASAGPRRGRDLPALAYRSESVTQGTLFFCVPGFTRRRPRLRARGGRARRGGARLRAAARPGRARGDRAERARRDGAGRGRASTATRRASCASSASRARTARPRPLSSSATCSSRPASRPGCSGRSSRSSAAGESEVVRTTPEAIDLQRDVPRDARRRRPRLRDGGVLARARRCTARTRSTSTARSSRT